MTASITSHTELAHRVGDGIDVYLFWNESTNDVSIGLVDARTGESFEFEVDGSHALDAFNHLYAYAGHGGTTAGGVRRHRLAVSTDEGHARELTINGGAIMHARIDNPAVVVPGALKALQALGALGPEVRRPQDDALSRRAARQPDQRLQHLRRHSLSRAQACRRAGRAHQRRRRLGGKRPTSPMPSGPLWQ